MAEMFAFMGAGMDEPVDKVLKMPQGRQYSRYSMSASTEDPGSDAESENGKFAIPEMSATLSQRSTLSSTAVSQAFDVGEQDERARLEEWARWQCRRKQRLERRAVLREKYISRNAECRLGLCSSDCSQCKATASKPRLDIMP
jgi:hypothetical protein